MVLAALFTAIIVIMGFTPLGYIKIGVIEVTFLMIPVAIGATVLGPVWGIFFGAVFGLTSFIQCFGYSPFGVALLAINPVGTFITCLVPRILMGYLTGIIFRLISKIDKTKIISFIVTSISGALLNTIFFVASFLILFRNANLEAFAMDLSTMSVMNVILVLVTFNSILEIIVCGVIGTALSKVLVKFIPADITIKSKKAKEQ